MHNKIYRSREYIIFKVRNGYVVQNTKKKFENGHTHVKNYNLAKKLIKWSKNNEVPETKNTYILESLNRISNDYKYKERLKNEKEKYSKSNYYSIDDNVDRRNELRDNKGEKRDR